MKIEMLPELRRKKLDGGVECCRACYDDAKQGGVDGVDVVEMYDIRFLLEHFPQQVTGSEKAYDNQKDDEVRVGEGRDELRDGVVGHDAWQHRLLMCPSEGRGVIGKLYPHRVDGVGGYNLDISHCDMISFIHTERVGFHARHLFFRHLAKQDERVGPHHEVVVVRVMVCLEERQRINGMLRKRCVVVAFVHRAVLIARREHQHEHGEQQGERMSQFHQ